MKKYSDPEVNILVFESEEILSTSNPGGMGENGFDASTDPDAW